MEMHRGKKRKNRQVGLGASEIAFIEDEIAAVAMEYGLEIDEEVVKSINARQNGATKHKKSIPSTKIQSISLDSKSLQDLLPKQCSIGPCKSPGCTCRGYIHDKKGKHEDCFKCEHGKFLHSIVFSIESDDESKAIHGQVLLGMMCSLVLLGRLASTVVGSNAWTQASLELLQTSVQQYLKKQLQRAQEQKRDTPDVDRPVMMRLSTEMHSLILTATQAVAATGRTQMRIKLACYFDQMYLALYQAALSIYGRSCAAVPAPEEYLIQIDKKRNTSQTDYEMFISTILDGDIPPDFNAAYEVKPKHGNALLDLFLCRQREGIQLFYEPSMGMNGEMDKVLSEMGRKLKESIKKLTKKQRMNLNKEEIKPKRQEMPSYSLLEQWRLNCRTACDTLYSKAIPHPSALKAIAKYSPIVEMGAGLGYWNSLFPQFKIDSIPFDPNATIKYSPDSNDSEMDDAATTGIPTHSIVYHGAPDILDTIKDRTLFLCAPPTTSFARDCLRHYKGKYLIHVGEWYGETGDRQFECDVMKNFILEERVGVPNWGDTAYEMTIWKRKSKSNESSLAIISCSVCESTQRNLLKRCVLCKTMIYCSKECMDEHQAVHTAEHARRLLFLNNDASLKYDNTHHFQSF